MSTSKMKRIGNLAFAGAVIIGTAWPLSAETYAMELPPVSSEGSSMLQYTGSEEDKNKVVLLSTGDAVTDLPSLEEYLGKLTCSGCGRRCPLTSPQCRRGNSYVQSATDDYEAMVAIDSVTVDLEPVAEGASVPEDTVAAAEGNPQTGTAFVSPVAANGTSAMDVADKAIELLPLAGLACGGVYFGLDSLRRRKEK